MKHVRPVRAVEIGDKIYLNPVHAAKRWVDVAARDIAARAYERDPTTARSSRSFVWSSKYWVTGKSQRWRRVLPIFERLLR